MLALRQFAPNMARGIVGVSSWWRFGLRSQIALFVVVLLSIPYIGYRFVDETRGFFRHSQIAAQEQIAVSVSNLFAGQQQLLTQIPNLKQRQGILTKFQLEHGPTVDGNLEDWGAGLNFATDYYSSSSSDFGEIGVKDLPSMALVIAEYGSQLYLALQVSDLHRVAFNEASASARASDSYDHIDLHYINALGQTVRLQLLIEQPGAMSIRMGDGGAKHALTRSFSATPIAAQLRNTSSGYQIELAIPVALFGPKQQLYIGLVDADQAPADGPAQTHQIKLKGPEAGGFSALNTESPIATQLLAGHANAGLEITLYDSQLNRLAKVGSSIAIQQQTQGWSLGSAIERAFEAAFTQLLQLNNPPTDNPKLAQASLLNLAISGVTVNSRWASPTSLPIQATAKPILDGQGKVLGLVLVKQSTAQLLAWQRQALQKIAALSLGSMLLILFLLVVVFWRLAFRIRRLGQEAKQLVDSQGRLQANLIKHETHQPDELGDLARSLNKVVAQVHEHQSFLTQMPRTLSHEIKNPLNTISTSLGNMAREPVSDKLSNYLAMAQRGIYRIDGILLKLADAASLEQALTQDIKEPVDVAHLVSSYCAYQNQIEGGLVDFKGPKQGIMIAAVDYRIEQLLDKLLDNARDFRHPTTYTQVELSLSQGWVEIKVSNLGPPIDAAKQGQLFNSMVSHRGKASQANESHFGLGLYVARCIVHYHQGQISHHNLADDAGVCFTITLPALGLN